METRPITLSPEAWKWLEESAKGRGLGVEEFLAYIVTYTRLGIGDPYRHAQPPAPPATPRPGPQRQNLPPPGYKGDPWGYREPLPRKISRIRG